MLRQTNISEALLYFGMPNSFRKLLLYAILKFFNAVFEQSYHNIEQYKLEQYKLDQACIHTSNKYCYYKYNNYCR